MQDFFKVDEVVPIAPHRWLVRGQAWQTFRIGDTLYAAVGRSYQTVELTRFWRAGEKK